MTAMDRTEPHDIAEWRGRLAQALQDCLWAADRFATRAETMKLDQRVRALEAEGRERGFRPDGKSNR